MSKNNDGTQVSLAQTFANFFNASIGIFMFATPYALKTGGLGTGYIALVYLTLATIFSTNFLTRISIDHPNIKTYGGIAHRAFGKTGDVILRIFLTLELLVGCASIIILASETLEGLTPMFSRTLYALIIWLAQFPVTMFSDRLSWLTWFSIIGILSLVFLSALLVQVGLTPPPPSPPSPSPSPTPGQAVSLSSSTGEDYQPISGADHHTHYHGGELLDIPSALSSSVFFADIWSSFYTMAMVSSQLSTVSVWPSMLAAVRPEDRTYWKLSGVSTIVISVVGLLVSVVGFLGYTIFGTDSSHLIMLDIYLVQTHMAKYAVGVSLSVAVIVNAVSKYGIFINPALSAVEPTVDVILFTLSTFVDVTGSSPLATFASTSLSPSFPFHGAPHICHSSSCSSTNINSSSSSNVVLGSTVAPSLFESATEVTSEPSLISNDDRPMLLARSVESDREDDEEGDDNLEHDDAHRTPCAKTHGCALLVGGGEEEESSSWMSSVTGITTRLVATILCQLFVLLIVLLVPNFALVSGLIGSALSIPLYILWPVACYLRLYWKRIGIIARVCIFMIVLTAMMLVVAGVIGTIYRMIESY